MSFRVIFPSDGKNLFDGGLNNKYEKSIIPDNESPDCLNVIFENGSVGTRNGFAKVNTASVGTFVCDGLYTRKGTNNAETMVAFYGGNAYTLDNTSLVTIPSAQSVFTMGNRVGAALMENHLFVGNGGVIPYKYNGTDFTRHGAYPPSFTASFYTGAAGNPNGQYQYKIVYVNSALVQSNPSEASATFVVTAAKVSLTCLPIAPQSWGVSSRELYRTVTSGATFLRVATIADNTTTTYLDDVADANLGAAAPSGKGVPPKYSTIIYHQNRLFMNDVDNPGFVWYTDLNEPYTIGTTNFQIVGDQSSDLVKGFGVQDNNLVVFCERNVWVIYMPDTTATNWKVIKAKSSYTSKSPHGNFSYNNRVGFPAMQNDKFVGIGAIIGDQVELSTTATSNATMGSELKSDRIEPDMFDVQEAYVGNISTVVYKNKAYITLTKASGNTTNNRVYVMDFSINNVTKIRQGQKEAWSVWSGLNAAQFTVYNGSLYYGSSTATGFLYKENPNVYSDDGSAINSYIWTKEFVGLPGHESFHKDFRFANFLVDLPGAYFMNVGVRTDSDAGSGTEYPVSIDPQTELWGTMVWGTDVWGGGAFQQDVKFPLSGARGKRIQFKFSNQNKVNQKFKIHWMNFTYNLKGPR